MSGWFYGRVPPSRPDAGQSPVGVWAASEWYRDCLGCPTFGPAPARCVRCPTGQRPGIDRFIGDQIAMRNAASGFKSELKVTRCPPDSPKWSGSRKESRGAPVENAYKSVANPSQANCEVGISAQVYPLSVSHGLSTSRCHLSNLHMLCL